MKILKVSIIVLCLFAGSFAQANVAIQHPRLLVDDKEFAEIKKTIQKTENRALVNMHSQYMAIADQSVEAAPEFVFKTNASGKLLNVSRQAFLELGACSYAWRYTGAKKYLKRVESILSDVCSFESWNPKHYLDVAEMAMGVSFAYDWTYSKLSPKIKAMCEEKIFEYIFDTAESDKYRIRFQMANNWGQVLNSALVCSCIAFYDVDPSRCEKLISRAVTDNLISMERGYAPDGIYPEGAGYWDYGTSFQILGIEALARVYGSDFGLSECRGFKESASFIISSCGNIGKAYNFSDSSEKCQSVPTLWYFAWKSNNPNLVFIEQKKECEDDFQFKERVGFMHIISAARCPGVPEKGPENLVFSGRGGNPIVIARSGWGKNDIYLGTKGGSTRNNHSHMDAGSFVYEDGGVRWICEPGFPGYVKTENLMKSLGGSLWKRDPGSLRWKMFGYNNAQHSTVTINNKDHSCNGYASLEEVFDSPEKKGGMYDMTSIFGGEVKSARRTLAIIDNEYLEIVDEISAADSLDANVYCCFPTSAKIAVTESGIVLIVQGKKMILQSEGTCLKYSTQMLMPKDVPEPFKDFYNTETKFAGVTFTIPSGKSVTVTSTLKRMDKK